MPALRGPARYEGRCAQRYASACQRESQRRGQQGQCDRAPEGGRDGCRRAEAGRGSEEGDDDRTRARGEGEEEVTLVDQESIDRAIRERVENGSALVIAAAQAIPRAWGALAARGVIRFRDLTGRAPTDEERRAIWRGGERWRCGQAVDDHRSHALWKASVAVSRVSRRTEAGLTGPFPAQPTGPDSRVVRFCTRP